MKWLMGLSLLLLMACGSSRKWKALQSEQQQLLAQTLAFQQQQAQVLHRFSVMDSMYQKERLVIYPQGEISWDASGFKGAAKQIVWEQTAAAKKVQHAQMNSTSASQKAVVATVDAQAQSSIKQTASQKQTPLLLLWGSALAVVVGVYLLWRYWLWKR